WIWSAVPRACGPAGCTELAARPGPPPVTTSAASSTARGRKESNRDRANAARRASIDIASVGGSGAANATTRHRRGRWDPWPRRAVGSGDEPVAAVHALAHRVDRGRQPADADGPLQAVLGPGRVG